MSENFKGVFIPADIFLIKDLSLVEKILIVTILGLDNGSGCFASNEYLSKFVQITPTSCSGIISNLKKSGLLFEPKKFDGRKRYLSVNTNILYDMPLINMDADLKKDLSSISKTIKQTNENNKTAYKKPEGSLMNNERQPNENHNHINIVNNIVDNIDYNKEKSEKQVFAHTPERKSKVVNISYKLPNDFSHELKETFEAFMLYKKQRKESYKSEHSINLLIKKIQDNRVHFSDTLIIEVINMSMENNWAGIFFDKLQKNKEDKKQIAPENPFLKPIKFDLL